MSAVQNRQPSEVEVLRTQMDGMGGQFQNALPAHIPVERFMRVVMTAIQNNNDLLRCDRRSLFNAAMKAAQDGLLPDGRDGAMVPYKGDVQWMPMIGGIRKKVRNSGEIATWDVEAVYANDEFDFQLGDDPFIKHKPALRERGELIMVYSIATLKSGEKSRAVMSIEEVEKIRAKSRSKNGPWADPTFYPEMAKKTVARRHSKVLPMSSDLDDLIRRDDALYDLDGAREEAQATRPRSLAGRLDMLAQEPGETIDSKTGEVVDNNEMGGSTRGSSQDRAAADKVVEDDGAKTKDRNGEIDNDDPIKEARRAGREDAKAGKSKRQMPSRYRNDDTLFDAYNEGHDSVKDDD